MQPKDCKSIEFYLPISVFAEQQAKNICKPFSQRFFPYLSDKNILYFVRLWKNYIFSEGLNIKLSI